MRQIDNFKMDGEDSFILHRSFFIRIYTFAHSGLSFITLQSNRKFMFGIIFRIFYQQIVFCFLQSIFMSTIKMEQKNIETQSADQQQNKLNHGSLDKDGKESRTTPLDLSPHSPTRLPLELECEIFKCLKEEIQTKFIWGMGRGIYGMFRHRLLVKTKKLCNPKGNNWKCNEQHNSKNNDSNGWGLNVFAQKGFSISIEECRLQNNFPGTILYYFEITNTSAIWCRFFVSLSDGCVPNDFKIGKYPNSYAIPRGSDYCTLSGTRHWFKFPDGPIGGWRGCGDVYGCGLVMDPTDKLAIFFTLNGILIDEQIPIIRPPSKGHLFPTVSMWNSSLEANFGDNPSKAFKYDITECPGLVFE